MAGAARWCTFLGSILVFTDKLWAGRTNGVGLYTSLAARYATEFEMKWTDANVPIGEPLLGTLDIQAMADLANVVGVVKGMRWITVGPRLLTMMTVAAIVPLAPLLVFQYPIAERAQKSFWLASGEPHDERQVARLTTCGDSDDRLLRRTRADRNELPRPGL